MKLHKCKAKTPRRANERDSPEYWERRLKQAGLTMAAGHNPNWLTYGHMVQDLDFDGLVTYVPPTGESLEQDEWPISLC